ncbi:MAG TPA: hypothetical protein VMX54_20125 [Vicinamibacteria bacterium]|nr:hypothetical protein [Vicinamibacteria bacterium]
MRQRSETFPVATRRGLTGIADAVREVVRAAAVREGLCSVFIRQVLGE